MPWSQSEQPVPLQQGIKKAPGTKPRCFHVISSHLISSHLISCHVMSCHVMSCHVMSFRFVSRLSPSEKACPWRSRYSLAAWAYRWQLPSRSTGRCCGLANGHDAFWGLACSLFDVSASSALESCHLRSLSNQGELHWHTFSALILSISVPPWRADVFPGRNLCWTPTSSLGCQEGDVS